jgi:hypothetical protein
MFNPFQLWDDISSKHATYRVRAHERIGGAISDIVDPKVKSDFKGAHARLSI